MTADPVVKSIMRMKHGKEQILRYSKMFKAKPETRLSFRKCEREAIEELAKEYEQDV